MSDPAWTVDSLFEWLHNRFGCQLPRQDLVGKWDALDAFWKMELDISLSQDAQPPISIKKSGQLEVDKDRRVHWTLHIDVPKPSQKTSGNRNSP